MSTSLWGECVNGRGPRLTNGAPVLCGVWCRSCAWEAPWLPTRGLVHVLCAGSLRTQTASVFSRGLVVSKPNMAMRSASIQVMWFGVSFQACSPAAVLSTAPGKDQLLSSHRPGTSHPTQSRSSFRIIYYWFLGLLMGGPTVREGIESRG